MPKTEQTIRDTNVLSAEARDSARTTLRKKGSGANGTQSRTGEKEGYLCVCAKRRASIISLKKR